MPEEVCVHSPCDTVNRLQTDFHAMERQYSGLVFSVALRCLGCRQMAQEVTQDVFLLLAKKAPDVLTENPGGWLHRTAVLKARERLRAEGRYRRRVAEYARQQAAPAPVPDALTEMEQVLERLDEALNKLPERDRHIIFLRYFEGLDARAMAERLNTTPEAAQKQCERARSRLAGKLAISGALAASVLRAQFSGNNNAVQSALRLRPAAPAAMCFCRGTRRKFAAALGAAAGICALVPLLPARQGETRGPSPPGRSPDTPHLSGTEVAATVLPGPSTAVAEQDARRITVTKPDLAALAALLERADEGDVAAATAAETILARQEVAGLSAAVDSIPTLALPVNQLRVLALGMVRHLTTRDGRAAVLAGERLWRSQHGATAPLLAGLVNEGLAKWAREDYTAASRWYETAAAEGLFEDRGQPPGDTRDQPGFQQALELESSVHDLAARVALARRILQSPEPRGTQPDIPSWSVQADVWAHKLTPGDARALADALWSCRDVPARAVFQFRLALVTLPSMGPSLESLRWAATPSRQRAMDAALAAAVVSAWQQRHPAGAAAWLATLEGLPEDRWIASAMQDGEAAASARYFPPPAAPTP